MAVVSSLGITFATASGTETVVATPALGDLIVIIAAYTGNVTTTAPTDNNADGHGTYTLVTSALANTSVDRILMWVRADAVQRAASTTFTLAPGATTGGGLQVFKITGMTTASVRRSGAQANGAAAGTPAAALGAAALTGNPLIGAVLNGTNPATMTPPTGFTESQDVGYTVPAAGLETAFASSGITASTITWGSTSATAFGAVAAEFDSSVGRPGYVGNFEDITKTQSMAFKRSSLFMLGDKWARRGPLWTPRREILVPA